MQKKNIIKTQTQTKHAKFFGLQTYQIIIPKQNKTKQYNASPVIQDSPTQLSSIILCPSPLISPHFLQANPKIEMHPRASSVGESQLPLKQVHPLGREFDSQGQSPVAPKTNPPPPTKKKKKTLKLKQLIHRKRKQDIQGDRNFGKLNQKTT